MSMSGKRMTEQAISNMKKRNFTIRGGTWKSIMVVLERMEKLGYGTGFGIGDSERDAKGVIAMREVALGCEIPDGMVFVCGEEFRRSFTSGVVVLNFAGEDSNKIESDLADVIRGTDLTFYWSGSIKDGVLIPVSEEVYLKMVGEVLGGIVPSNLSTDEGCDCPVCTVVRALKGKRPLDGFPKSNLMEREEMILLDDVIDKLPEEIWRENKEKLTTNMRKMLEDKCGADRAKAFYDEAMSMTSKSDWGKVVRNTATSTSLGGTLGDKARFSPGERVKYVGHKEDVDWDKPPVGTEGKVLRSYAVEENEVWVRVEFPGVVNNYLQEALGKVSSPQ